MRHFRVSLALALFAAGCSVGPATSTTAPTQAPPALQAATAATVPVCHVDDTSGYALLAIAPQALAGHLGHGDGQPGGTVPGINGYVFTTECRVQETSPTGCGPMPAGLCASAGVCGSTTPACIDSAWRCQYPSTADTDAFGNLLDHEVRCTDSLDNNCDGIVDNCTAP